MTLHPFTSRNKDAGLPGNGGLFAPTSRAESDATLVKTDSTELSALRDAITAAGRFQEAADHAMRNASAAAIDQMIVEHYPTAKTAIFNRSYDSDSFVIEELRDGDDEIVPLDGESAGSIARQINTIAENIGGRGDYLGEDTDTVDGESVEFTVGTVAASNAADDAAPGTTKTIALNLNEPDLSSLTPYQLVTLQSAVITRTGLVSPIIDATEASYQLFDGMEYADDAATFKPRIAALEARFGGRDGLAQKLVDTDAWRSLEDVMIEAITDENKGTRAMTRQAIAELEAE
jgi:hypothetical protein